MGNVFRKAMAWVIFDSQAEHEFSSIDKLVGMKVHQGHLLVIQIFQRVQNIPSMSLPLPLNVHRWDNNEVNGPLGGSL